MFWGYPKVHFKAIAVCFCEKGMGVEMGVTGGSTGTQGSIPASV